MDIEMDRLSSGASYKLLTALVVPRPIAWISTLHLDGRVNLAPYSFFNVLGNRPPVVAFGPGYKTDGSTKDTAANAERSGEFVINMVDPSLVAPMHQSAAPYPADVSEAELLGIEMVASHTLRTPGVRASRVRLECAFERRLVIGENQILFGLVRHMYAEDGLLDPQTLHLAPQAFTGVGRLQGPGWYCTTSDQFDLGAFPRAPEQKA